MKDHRFTFLSTVALFSNLPKIELDDIADDFHLHTYANETTLFLEGESARAFYIVAAGRVRLYKLSLDGREQPLFVMQPRDFFDIPPLLDNRPHPASATTLGDARLYVVSRERMVEIMQRHPQVAGSLLPYLSKRLRDLAALTGDLAFTDVSTRLARLILVYARGGATDAPGHSTLLGPLPQSDRPPDRHGQRGGHPLAAPLQAGRRAAQRPRTAGDR